MHVPDNFYLKLVQKVLVGTCVHAVALFQPHQTSSVCTYMSLSTAGWWYLAKSAFLARTEVYPGFWPSDQLSCAQVTRLCRAHRLHSALAFLFTRGLADYAAPAAELLLSLAFALQTQGNLVVAEDDASTGSRPSAKARLSNVEVGASAGIVKEADLALNTWDESQVVGYKLMVYLRCCFRGAAFPPGLYAEPDVLTCLTNWQFMTAIMQVT